MCIISFSVWRARRWDRRGCVDRHMDCVFSHTGLARMGGGKNVIFEGGLIGQCVHGKMEGSGMGLWLSLWMEDGR
jgi:hypothetical protein